MEVCGEDVDWIYVAQDSDRWRAVVNKVMNIRVSKKREISWLTERAVFFKRTLLHVVGYFQLVTAHKVVPLYHAGAKEKRNYNSSFLTSALDGDEWSASRPGHALPLGKRPPVPIGQETMWASELVWTQRLKEKSFPLPGIEPQSSSM
jgi:hypothetical protein